MENFRKPVELKVESISTLRSSENNPELATPIFHNDLVIIASSRKTVAIFDLKGDLRKQFYLQFKPVSTPAIKQEKLYLGGADGRFHCLSLESGKEIWNYKFNTLHFSRPEPAGNNIIFQTAMDRVVSLDPEDGKWRWEYQHIRPEDLAICGLSPPVVSQDKVFIGLAGGYVACMNVESGKLAWKKRIFKGEQFMDVDAPIEVDESNVYAVSAGGEIAALNRGTGKVLWRYQAGGLAGCRLDHNRIFLATDEAELIALDKVTGENIWSAKLTDKKITKFYHLPTRPAVVGEFVVTVTRGGKVLIMDKQSGELLESCTYLTKTSTPAVPLKDKGFLVLDNKGIARLWLLK